MRTETLFTNARIIDGTGKAPLENAWLHVVNNTVHASGTGPAPQLPPEATLVDASGATLMPGLMDAHAHPGNLHVDIREVPKLPPAVYVHEVSRILERDVTLGFTTLRDAAGLDSGFRDAVARGLINGPRLYLCIAPLSQTGGHADKRSPYMDAPIPRNSIGVYPFICDSPDEMRRAAREALRKGADHIKIMADGGVTSPTGGPGHSQLSVPEIRAAVEVAESNGSYVMAHVYTAKSTRMCVEAGVRSIEHATLIDKETAELMARTNTFLVPSLTVFEVLAEKKDELGFSQSYLDKLDLVREGGLRALEYAYKAGVRIASASDLIGPYQQYRGRELAIKATVMGAMNAIVSATKTTAELMMIDHKLGTLEPGKLADIIMVEGNPLDDLRIFEPGTGKVLLTMIGGKSVWKKGCCC